MHDTKTLLVKATESAKSGALDEARTHLAALLQLDPEHEIGTGMLAAIHAEQNQFAAAAELFSRTLEINPENPLASLQLGLMQLHLDQPQAALETFDFGIARKSFGANACFVHFYRALALLRLERPDEARTALAEAQKFMPTDHALYSRTVELMIKLERSH